MLKLNTQSKYKIWFTSDWHLGHKNIIKFSHRPFMGVAEMEKMIIGRVNEYIATNDISFFLGDFTFDKRIADRIVPALPGKWIWIIGNHDNDFRKYLDKNNIEHHNLLDIQIDKQPITLCHYPMVSWSKSCHGAWQLHGHHHWDTDNQDSILFNGPILNVNIENSDYYPLSFEQIKHWMGGRGKHWDLIDRNRDKTKTEQESLSGN